MSVFQNVKLINSGTQHSVFQLVQDVMHLVRHVLVHQAITASLVLNLNICNL